MRVEVYQAANLDAQLEGQIKNRFSNAGKGLWRDGNRIYVSKIFDWFAEGLDGGDVRNWLRVHVVISGEFSLRYFKYDWSLSKVR